MMYDGACLWPLHAPYYLCYVILFLFYVMTYDAMIFMHAMSICHVVNEMKYCVRHVV